MSMWAGRIVVAVSLIVLAGAAILGPIITGDLIR